MFTNHPRRSAKTLLGGLAFVAAAFAGPLASPVHAEPGIGTISGTVRALDGSAVQNAHVFAGGSDTYTDGLGHYSILGAAYGPVDVTVQAPCRKDVHRTVTVDGDETENFVSLIRHDASNDVCMDQPGGFWSDATPNLVPLTGDDVITAVDLPFAFPFYGKPQTKAWVSTNGYLTFSPQTATDATYHNGPLLDPKTPRNGIFAFWDDLLIDADADVRTEASGNGPEATFVIEWRNALVRGTTDRVDVFVLLASDGFFAVGHSGPATSDAARAGSATIGVRNAVTGSGAQSLLRSYDEADPFSTGATWFGVNHKPVAKAGADKTVASGTTFTLNGLASSDPDQGTSGDGLAYRWKQVGGPATAIAHPHQAKTTVAGGPGPKTLTYQLQVIDVFGDTSTDTVKITVKA